MLTAGADAFLGARGSLIRALVKAKKDILELVHAGIGKQKGGVIPRNNGAGCHDLVTLGGEIIEVGLAYIRDFHPNNYRIGTELGQTLKLASDHSLTITNRLKTVTTYSRA